MRDEGLLEAAVQDVVAHEHLLAAPAGEEEEEEVPLNELTDWMLERSRR